MTSPPYWGLRDYGAEGQLGLEKTPEEYVAKMVAVFREVRRVLKNDGTLWLNLGDSYAGSTIGGGDGAKTGTKSISKRITGLKSKDLVGIPWRVAFALQADGWCLRSDIIWHKPNPMPESVKDRPTKAHEYLFLMAKSEKYFYDGDAIKEPASESSGWAKQRAKGVNTWKYNDTDERKAATGQTITHSTFGEAGKRNKRTVWTITPKPFKGAHFAVFPPDLVRPCVLAGSKPGDVVIDPFNGAGTTGLVAGELGREYIGIELNPDYIALTRKRLEAVAE